VPRATFVDETTPSGESEPAGGLEPAAKAAFAEAIEQICQDGATSSGGG
jgi:hypothetical protein